MHSYSQMFSWPRIQFFEIGDLNWCPSWLREHEQFCLTQLWNLRVPGWSRGSLATQACEALADHFRDLSSFTFIDCCAGAGGPSPVMEAELNKRLVSNGNAPVQFILTDLFPHVEEWEGISKKQQNITYIEKPVDARTVQKFTDKSQTKECRVFNICFHHFDDKEAAGILKSAVRSADAFIIFEITSRDVGTCLCTPLVFFWSFFVTLVWYITSPIYLLFTFVLPVTSLVIWIDGLISCLRTRTPKEVRSLLEQTDLDLTGWSFKHGEKIVQWPFITLYYYIGIKSDLGQN